MSKIKKIAATTLKWIRVLLMLSGILTFLLIILATTSVPFWMRYKMANYQSGIPNNVETFVIMGGGAMPSESALMRLWYAVEMAENYPGSSLVIAMPGELSDSSNTVFGMYQYLLDHGVDSSRILLENEGVNTRGQAVNCKAMVDKGLIQEPIVIITSPGHMKRSILSFEKAGLKQISGRPAFEDYVEVDLRFDDNDLGGNESMPDVGSSIMMRYRFWEYLHYEIEIARENVALAYYWLKGWV